VVQLIGTLWEGKIRQEGEKKKGELNQLNPLILDEMNAMKCDITDPKEYALSIPAPQKCIRACHLHLPNAEKDQVYECQRKTSLLHTADWGTHQ